jgi:hypothetical protein
MFGTGSKLAVFLPGLDTESILVCEKVDPRYLRCACARISGIRSGKWGWVTEVEEGQLRLVSGVKGRRVL